MTSEQRIIEVLMQENEVLRERVAYLETAIIKAGPRYDLLGLTGQEARLMAALADGRKRSKKQLLAIIYSDRLDQDLPEIKIIDVFVCKARKKLAVHGIKIDTVWGEGYALAKPSVVRLREVLMPFGGFEEAEAA